MKPVVVQSINAPGEMRCVDILHDGARFGWVECRRDPEDGRGWRHLMPPRMGFDSQQAADAGAREATQWMLP